MIVKCSGCEEKMGEKEPFEDKRVSHGICRKCLIRIYGPEYASPEQGVLCLEGKSGNQEAQK